MQKKVFFRIILVLLTIFLLAQPLNARFRGFQTGPGPSTTSSGSIDVTTDISSSQSGTITSKGDIPAEYKSKYGIPAEYRGSTPEVDIPEEYRVDIPEERGLPTGETTGEIGKIPKIPRDKQKIPGLPTGETIPEIPGLPTGETTGEIGKIPEIPGLPEIGGLIKVREFKEIKKRDLEKLKKLKSDQLEKIRKLGGREIRKLSELREGQLERISRLQKNQLERLSKIPKRKLEKLSNLKEEHIGKIAKLRERQIEKLSLIEEGKLRRIAGLGEERLKRIASAPREVIEKVSDLGETELQTLGELDEESINKLARLDRKQVRSIAKLRDKTKIKKLLQKVRPLSKKVIELKEKRDRFLFFKERLREAKKDYLKAKAHVKLLRKRIQNTIPEEREKIEALIREKIATGLSTQISAMIEKLENLKEAGTAPDNAEELIARLNELLSKLESGDLTNEELKGIAQEIKELWKKAKEKGTKKALNFLAQKISNVIPALEKRFEKADELISKIEEAGASQELLDRLQKRRDKLREVLGNLKTKTEEEIKEFEEADEQSIGEARRKAKRFTKVLFAIAKQHYEFMKKLAKILHRLENKQSTEDITIEEEVTTVEEAETEVEQEIQAEEQEELQEEVEIETEAETEVEEEVEVETELEASTDAGEIGTETEASNETNIDTNNEGGA